jgi:hypothetical protein
LSSYFFETIWFLFLCSNCGGIILPDSYEKIDTLLVEGRLDEAEALLSDTAEELISDAVLLCEIGDFLGALEIFRYVSRVMQHYYNESDDITHLMSSIAALSELLDTEEKDA